ncbi:MAG: hypothetical protein R6U63_05240 [Longimicrobiales bacterium]
MRPNSTRHRTPLTVGLAALILAVAPTGIAAQGNILHPPDTIEKRLAHDDFEIVDRRGSRFDGDRTNRVAMSFADGTMMVAKWALAPQGGEAYNNNPRYEVAAYELQKLFLRPHEFVVPPTVLRAFDLGWFRSLEPGVRPTFNDTESVLVVLQYWLFDIAGAEFWDRRRFASDSVYARHLANFNIFTYLVRHNDQNQGNYLISGIETDPRVFSVDNGIAFQSSVSDQGANWRRLRVDRLPTETIDRLRELTEEDVRRRLETVAQFRIQPDGTLTAEPTGPARDPGQGIRRSDRVIQLGLDRREIDDVWRRIQRLLARVDDGDFELF